MPETFSKMVADDMGVVRIAKAITERGYSKAITEAESPRRQTLSRRAV